MITPEIPPERQERADQLIHRAVHTLMHVSKVLARVGILIPTDDADDAESILQAAALALDLIDDAPLSQRTSGALFVMTLRWLTSMDMIMAYRMLGESWREAAALDCVHQAEALSAIASQLLDSEHLN